MNQDAYFPLKNNLRSFESYTNQLALIDRIKHSILLHENLIFDHGSYGLLCNDKGGISFMDPDPQKFPEGFDNFNNVMAVADFGDTKIPIVEEGEGKFYRGSFLPVLEDLELLGEDFIKFISYDITDGGNTYLEKAISETEQYKDLIELPDICRDQILKNFHESLMVSNSLGTPIMVDNLHDNLIEELNTVSIKRDERLNVLDCVLNTAENHLNGFEIPDFSSLATETILDLRNDKMFKNFREKILEINIAVAEKNPEKLNEIVMGEVITELSSQMGELVPSRSKIVIRLFTGILGSIPGVSELLSIGTTVFDAAEGFKNLNHYENSWLAFILTYQH